MDESVVEILLRAKAEGEHQIRQVKDLLTDLQHQAILTNSTMMLLTPAVLGNAAATSAASSALGSVGPSGTAAAGGTAAASAGMIALGAAVAVALAVIAPFLLLLVGAVVILGAFVIGMAAVATSLALVGGLMFGMAGVVVMLADRLFTTGKIMSDPLLGLEHNLSKMADTWGRAALPMANQIISWLNGLIPAVQAAGLSLLNWFGPRLPAMLNIGTVAFNDLMGALRDLGKALAPLIDQMIKAAPQWEGFFKTLLDLGVQAVVGLLTNLLALSRWFMERWPEMKPIVMEILAAIGIFVMGALQLLGRLADWFIHNWPQIKKNAIDTWHAIRDGWIQTQPLIEKAIELFKALLPVMKWLSEHADLVKFALMSLAAIVALVVAVMIVVGAIILVVAAALIWLFDKIDSVRQAFDSMVGWIMGHLPQFGSLFRHEFDWIGTSVQALIDLLGKVAGAIRAIPAIPTPPSQVPGMTPHYQSGGVVTGPIGAPQLAVVHGGERVTPVGGGGTTMDDTNELLAAIYQVLYARLQMPTFNTAAYARP